MDFLVWVIGPEVESVYAARSNSRAHAETGEADTYLNLVKWKNGAIASVLVTWGMPEAFELVEDQCLIIGSKGYAETTRPRHFRFTTDEVVETVEPPPLEEEPEMRDQAQAFVDVIEGKAEPRSTLIDGLRAQKLTLAAEQAAETGEPVLVDV
jgi:predicted dehydrogenase